MANYSTIKVDDETYANLLKLRLKAQSRLGRDLSITETILLLTELAEKYPESLKMLGVVEETKTAWERISFRERKQGWLYPHARKIIGNTIERSPEKPPDEIEAIE